MKKLDPKLDLRFERNITTPPHLVWQAWTDPKILKKWFCPLPWKTVECEIDLRPGGVFNTVMLSPDGKKSPNYCSYLEVVKNEKLVWTNALLPDYRPASNSTNSACVDFFFTAVIELKPSAKGTKYVATVMHASEEHRKQHEKMGFQDGWGKALDQLVALYQKN